MELMNFNIAVKGININICIIYRPWNGSVIEFCDSLAMIQERNINTDKGKLNVLNDVNIHLDEENNPDTITFNDFLESFWVINYTTFFTHAAKHILDLVISNEFTMVQSVLPRHHLSDHSFVHAILEIKRPIPPCRLVRYRKYKDFDKNKFRQDLIDSFMDKSPNTMDKDGASV